MNACPHCQRELSEHTEKDGCLNAWAATLRRWTDVRFSKRCGFWLGSQPGQQGRWSIPSYTTDIAAAYALEESLLTEKLRHAYTRNILLPSGGLPSDASDDIRWELVHASPYHRTVAFVAAKEMSDG